MRCLLRPSIALLLAHSAAAFSSSISSMATIGPSRRTHSSTHRPSCTQTALHSGILDFPTAGTANDISSDPLSLAQVGAWIPLGSASSLDGLTPIQVQVCAIDLVVWQTNKASNQLPTFSAFVDACPHRMAPLSQGRIDPQTGCLECPYHGWKFDAQGNLTHIPQIDNDTQGINPFLQKYGAATALPVHAAGDLLFVFLPSDICGEAWPIERLPETQYPYLHDSIRKKTTYYVRELPYSIDFLIENFMDPAHIPFAHHSLQGVREDGSPIPMTVLVNNYTHVEATFVDSCNDKQRDGVLSFQRPAFYHFRIKQTNSNTDKDNNNNPRLEYTPRLLIYVAPVRAGMCRVILPDIPIPFLPKFLAHAASNRFLNSDSWLHDTERAVRVETPIHHFGSSLAVGAAKVGKKTLLGLNYLVASKSDLGPSLFRKWWAENGLADSPPHFFGPVPSQTLLTDRRQPMSRREQTDPWLFHSRHCSHCRKSLRLLKRLESTVLVGALLVLVLMKQRPWMTVASVVTVAWVRSVLQKCVSMIEGSSYPSEISDRSVASMRG